MENASKALLIAGSILIALMILSLIIYVFTSTSRMAQAQEGKKETEEIVAFNQTYEAYNKKRMYGTDIITVVNKAIEYNRKATEKIEIILITHNDYETTEEIITTDSNGITTSTKTKKIKDLSLKADTYDATLLKDFFGQEVNDEIGVKEGRNTTKNVYSSLTTFKMSIFECVNIAYNKNGRIASMKFEEKINFSEY